MQIILKSFTKIAIFFICVIIIEWFVKFNEIKRETKNEAYILGDDINSKELRNCYKKKKIIKYSIIAGTSIAILIVISTGIKLYL